MTKTVKHVRNARGARRLLAGAGLVLTGATLAAVGAAAFSPSVAGAGESKSAKLNYVVSVTPDAVSQVLLDEDVAIQFSTAVQGSSVGPDTILVRTGPTNGEQARGRYVVGAFLYDRSVQRRAVIRPEAVREYYELVYKGGIPRADAQIKAAALIRKVETTGKLSLLRPIDTGLRSRLGDKAGTRLDDAGVYGIFPAQLPDLTPLDNDDPLTLDSGDDPLEPYRTRIAGDDALWQAYLGGGDVNAFAQLALNSEYERFYHEVDPATGVPASTSVLRKREYRRVLIDRRAASRVMFVPEIPIRADLADTGYTAGKPYAVIVPSSSPGVFNTVLSREGKPLAQTAGRDFSTLFMTVPATFANLFRAAESRTGVSLLQAPRIINQTPPNGESYVDQTTDWEDPDNQFTVPIPQRKTFSIRLRFAQALDPRTINTTSITLTKVATLDATGKDIAAVNVPVAIGTFLNQHRLGIVEVEITPATNLDPQSRYSLVAKTLIRSLGGQPLPVDYQSSFTVGAGKPPLRAIIDDFVDNTNRADPTSVDTAGQITTAYWPSPKLYDTTNTGKLAAAFMPFAGTGVGAPTDPRDPGSPTVTALVLTPGQSITFLTEQVDPSNPTALGSPIEYNYASISMTNSAATAVGRYPLILRSQSSTTLTAANILCSGGAGGDGSTNAGTTTGPTGGLGGASGPGGYRGGDGGNSPLTDSSGTAVLDAGGNFQFDVNKFNGTDGLPSFLTVSGKTGGGSGGFSGDAEAANSVDCFQDPGDPTGLKNTKDLQCTPARYRECGGGAGHATAGGDGDGARGSGKVTAGGYRGGLGGSAYGFSDFRDQPRNGLFGNIGVPRLTFGAGGAGGGGGGAEDNTSTSDATADGLTGSGDAGGGGGGGGGGAIQLVARTGITIDSSVVDASGGRGGRTFNAARSNYGKGAPGGCGAGGSIWLQCYGDIIVQNGSRVTAAGGDNSGSIGFFQVDVTGADKQGKGGLGGSGFVRFEDADGAAFMPDFQANPLTAGTHVFGTFTQSTFRPYDDPTTTKIEQDFQAFPGSPFVVNFSQGFSKWFNAQLDTPSFSTDPATSVYTGVPGDTFQSQVNIWVRSAPNDTTNTGHPNLNLATSAGNTAPWTAYVDVNNISRKRFLQFRVDFTVPLSYDFDLAKLPYVDYLKINIDLN